MHPQSVQSLLNAIAVVIKESKRLVCFAVIVPQASTLHFFVDHGTEHARTNWTFIEIARTV